MFFVNLYIWDPLSNNRTIAGKYSLLCIWRDKTYRLMEYINKDITLREAHLLEITERAVDTISRIRFVFWPIGHG